MSGTQEVGDIFGSGKGGVYDAMLRSPTVLIASIGLWGMNIYVFKWFTIDYIKVLNHDIIKLEEQQQQQQDSGGQQQVQSLQQQQQQPRRHRMKANNVSMNNSFDSTELTLLENAMTDLSTNSVNSTNSSTDTISALHKPQQHIETDGAIIEINGDDSQKQQMRYNDTNALNYANHENITSARLIGFSITLLLLLHSTYTIHISMLGLSPIGAVFAFYIMVTIVIVFPVVPSTRWLRIATKLVLHRMYELVHPRCYYMPAILSSSLNISTTSNGNIEDDKLNNGNSNGNGKIPRIIPFVDVFFADAMCSLSKVFFDWGMLINMAMYYPNPVPPSTSHILLPSSFAAVPYIIRARQCIVMWYVTSMKNDHANKYQHLWNALKYCSSILPICVSAYQRVIMKDRAKELEPLLILLLVINASYSLWWDIGMLLKFEFIVFRKTITLTRCHHCHVHGLMHFIVMDWGMMKNPTVAATALCSFPVVSSSSLSAPSSSTSVYQSVPTRDPTSSQVGEILRSPVGRNTSGALLPLPSSSSLLPTSSSAIPSSVSCWHALLRNRLRFGVGISVLILVTDTILRFSWTLRFYVNLFPSTDAFILFQQFLEVIRRALWNLLRVEWENLKQSGQHHHQHLMAKPMTPASTSIQMNSMNSNNIINGTNDEESTSFLRSAASSNKLGKW